MSNAFENWQQYSIAELVAVEPILDQHGFTLDEDQPHLKGERFLMQAVTTDSGKKLILLGTDTNGKRVVIKATRDQAGKQELERERRCRAVLHEMKFAAEIFHTPPELAWIEDHGFLISIHAFIEQPSTFLERPLPEQFTYALSAFKAQEGAHATTNGHLKTIKKTYQIRTASDYLTCFTQFSTTVTEGLPKAKEVHALLTQSQEFLSEHMRTVEQYCGFLTHTDFVPHNFRIDDSGTMYLLDHSSLTFGNKYEGWARFINFMELYNTPLASALIQYVNDNRCAEEQRALKLMRMYRLGEIMSYYTSKLPLSEDDLYTLNETRVFFWAEILKCIMEDTTVAPATVATYQKTRDQLRSDEEKERQQGLH